ncbi:sensor histidine kinase N-terminal domain-containing protein [Brevirhabdus sp.]|uniref:sensor histidine kinase N-terminal domain-containing protein n=1 Tax=Brevirhabdus sp. TaxID=2004514 RepID=UPI004057E91D
MSLTGRVALAVTGVLMIGGIFVSLAAFSYGRQAAREAYDRLLVGAANDIASSISAREGRAVVDLPLSAFQLLALAPDDRISYRVIGPDGATVTGYDSAPLPPAGAGGDQIFFDAPMNGEPARFVSLTRRFAERSFSGAVRVIVGHTELARRALALDITRGALIVLALTGIAMAVLAILAVRSALRPLDRIGAALRQRDPHDLTPVDLAVPREAAVMVGALNSFMARLDRQVMAMRTLIEDAAHQLRTPVAAIRAQSDLAARDSDPARKALIVERIHRRSVSLGRLLDQMLSRAMVIHRAHSAPTESFDLREMALEVLEECEPEGGGPSGVRIDLPADPVILSGDRLSLVEACKNLLNNAQRHGLPPLRMGVAGSDTQARIWVQDAGAGPPALIVGQAGRRFARSAASKADSAGLGLAIAVSVADAHGGRLELTAAPGDSHPGAAGGEAGAGAGDGADEATGGGFRATLILPRQLPRT